MLTSINPTTAAVIQTYPSQTLPEVLASVEKAHTAFDSWRKMNFAERGACFQRAAVLLRERVEQFAHLMAIEMGKPLAQGRGETNKCAAQCEYFAQHAEAFLAPEEIRTEASRSYVAYLPLGVIYAIMPWNFPLWQVFRLAVPTLMAGNTLVLKHAPNVTGCAQAIAQVFADAGFPSGVYEPLYISAAETDAFSTAVINHPAVQGVTLTGSGTAGRAIASKAGAALKKVVLELGGSDPYIVLADADLQAAAASCTSGRMLNSGQVCIAAKRYVVVDEVYEEFVERVIALYQNQVLGDPLNPTTTLGPLARPDLRDQLHRQVQDSLAKGATLLLGGEIPAGEGAFYPPTLLAGVQAGMPAFDEELFGPVAALVRVKDTETAIQVANNTSFGLGAAIFTRDVAEGERIAREELSAGACFVNDFVKSDSRLPLGGIKQSGFGREIGPHGIREWTNVKTVVVK
ncbi:MAG TPA: NAD-dependent succinate-semialdehyde dehydrogenase [Anaerolineales bacterium]|nr:NAD-dependent succinate-semialdehyde dehydrogenase [Anaerolineales bacterium]